MRKIIIFITIIIVILIATWVFFGWNKFNSRTQSPPPQNNSSSQDESPKIVSTNPDSLDNAVISADQIIEITFNKSLQNIGEFKLRIEPPVEITVELSQDRKTARIIPDKPLGLGTSYSIYIGRDTKFDGIGEWGVDKEFHFRTISYRGI